MNKKIILTILGFALLSLVVAIQITTFDNLLTEENLTFTGDENITRNITIPFRANVTNAFINLSGYSSPLAGTNQDVYSFNNITTPNYIDFLNLLNNSESRFRGGGFGAPCGFSSCDVLEYELDFPIDINNLGFHYSLYSASLQNWKWATSELSFYNWTSSSYNVEFEENHTFSTRECYRNNFNVTVLDDYINSGKVRLKFDFFGYDINDGGAGYGSETCDGKTFHQKYQGIINFNIRYVNNNIPFNPYLEIGTPDGNYEWNHSGEFNSTFSPSSTDDFSSILNTALNSGLCDCSGCSLNGTKCTIPFLFHSDITGNLEYSNLEINYDNIPLAILESPDNNTFSFVTKNFNCSSSDEVNLSNMTLSLFYPNGTLFNTQSENISGTSNSSLFSETFIETGDYNWNCKVINNESFSFTTTNRTIKVRELTLTPQTWIFTAPKLNEATAWSNSLIVTNPTDINTTKELNITTDPLAVSASIIVKNSSGDILSHTFNATDGQVKFNGSVFDTATSNFFISYNTPNITLSQTFYNVTADGNIIKIVNFTVTANSTRVITDIDSYLYFDDTDTVTINFIKCNDSNCSEDITDRLDVVFSDTDSDGTSDRVDWFIESLTNQSYQIKRLHGFPVQVSQDVEILNEPVRPFDNVEWRNTINFFNPNSFESENILKIELPVGSDEIELDDVPKNLQFDPFGTIAPYILIVDKNDPSHKETLFLLPGQTKTLILEYITDSVTILPEIHNPDFYKVGKNAEINQVMRIKNQADDVVTDVEHNIPITFAEDLRACTGEFKGGCPEDGDEDDYLIFDEKSRVNGNYKLVIDSINASEVKHVTLSYFIPTVQIIKEETGRSSVVGFEGQLNFKRFTYESISPLKLLDVRHTTGIPQAEIVDARLCDFEGVCEQSLDVVGGTIHLGTFDLSDRKVVELWFSKDEVEPMGMGFVGRFLEFGQEFDITDSPVRYFIGWTATEVNGKLVITTGKIIAIIIGVIALILLTIFVIYSRRKR